VGSQRRRGLEGRVDVPSAPGASRVRRLVEIASLKLRKATGSVGRSRVRLCAVLLAPAHPSLAQADIAGSAFGAAI
jgi:hypothetical protein